MASTSITLRTIVLAATMSLAAPVLMTAPAAASEIKYIVNNQPVTSYDIQRRAAFLRLQNRTGNLQQIAADEMIDQALRMAEAKRLRIEISGDQVASAYERFARTNKMSPSQMDQVLAQSGVTKGHFQDFIRAQMAWAQAISSRTQSSGLTSEQEAVQRMLQEGGEKPSTTEYMLQQVIFVVPAAERGKLGARKREAEALRQRFQSCETTVQFAKGLIDVTVRDLGRVLQPELPDDWKDAVSSTSAGAVTPVRETERGAEFIAVCSAREVNDDRVAQMVYQSEKQGSQAADPRDEMSKTYTAELRERAQIVQR